MCRVCCFLSRLPIEEGEDTVVILLKGELCETNGSEYKPFTIPIYGKYMGYGTIECTNPDDVLHYLDEEFSTKYEEEAISLPRNAKDLSKLINEISNNSVLAADHIIEDQFYEIRAIFMKRDLYNELLNIVENSNKYTLNRKTFKENFNKNLFSTLKEIRKTTPNSKYGPLGFDKFSYYFNFVNPNGMYNLSINNDHHTEITGRLLQNIYDKKEKEKNEQYLCDILAFKQVINHLGLSYIGTPYLFNEQTNKLLQTKIADYVLEDAKKTLETYRSENLDDATEEEILL